MAKEEKKKDYWGDRVKELLESNYENTGSIFPNKSKREDKHPDYQGCAKFNVEVDGVKKTIVVKISGWVKQKQDSSKWISMKLQPMKVVNEGEGYGEENTGSEEAEEPEDKHNPF
jgi:uncharacterized protein (DUF736 family)